MVFSRENKDADPPIYKADIIGIFITKNAFAKIWFIKNKIKNGIKNPISNMEI